MALAATVGLAGAVFGACGNGDDDGDDATAAGHAVAPSDETTSTETSAPGNTMPPGSGLEEPPGPADRGDPPNGLDEVALAVTTPDGEVLGWCVLLTEQFDEGLEGVTDLEGYAGLLYVSPEDIVALYSTDNYEITVSIAWFDGGGGLLATDDAEPCSGASSEDCPSYTPETWHRTMLQVPQGELEELGVVEGSRIAVGGPCAERS